MHLFAAHLDSEQWPGNPWALQPLAPTCGCVAKAMHLTSCCVDCLKAMNRQCGLVNIYHRALLCGGADALMEMGKLNTARVRKAIDPRILDVKKRVRQARRSLKRESKVVLSDEIIFFDDVAGNAQAKVRPLRTSATFAVVYQLHAGRMGASIVTHRLQHCRVQNARLLALSRWAEFCCVAALSGQHAANEPELMR